MTALDLDHLERVAREATLGSWEADRCMPYNRKPRVHSADGFLVGEIGNSQPERQEQWEADAAHIATFDPPTVLALISRLRDARDARASAHARMREIVEALEQAHQGFERIHASLIRNGPKQASGEMTAFFRDETARVLAEYRMGNVDV